MKDTNIINALKVIAIVAIGLTCLGYWIDSDPPYDNVWHTVFEFCILTAILFGALSLMFLGVYFLVNTISKQPKS